MSEQRHRLVSDDDGHDYLIPAENLHQWEDWVEKFYSCDDAPALPEWACELGYAPTCLTFVDPQLDKD